MRRWFLGIRDDDAITSDMRLEWMSAPTGDGAFLLILSLLGATALIWMLYRWEAKRIAVSGRFMLGFLRFAVIAAVVAMLCEPIAVLSKQMKIPSHLLVLVDRSQSMDLKDTWNDKDLAQRIVSQLQFDADTDLSTKTRSELVNRVLQNGLPERLALDGDRQVHVHSFAERMSPRAMAIPIDQNDELKGKNTAIGSSLQQSIMAYRGMPLAGILLVSDGQSNAGESIASIAELAKEQGITVQALAMGTEQGPSNASIVKLDANEIAFVKDTNNVGVLVQSRGLGVNDATVILERKRDTEDWQEVGRETIQLSDDGNVREVNFSFEEEKTGTIQLRAKLETSESELTLDDNMDQTQVQLIPQQIRVLFIAGSTFPEVQFLRNSLMLDKGVELSSWNQSAEDGYDHPGNNPIRRLPVNEEELNEYDCLILYDPDPAQWPGNFSELMTNFVSMSGGGLIYIAGEMETERSFQNQTSPEMAWLSLLPVIRDPGLFRSDVKMKLSSRNAWRLNLTSSGQRSHILKFADKPDENQRILNSLPGMYWHFPVTRAKAGATVLAHHGDPRMRNEFGPEVLLATHRVGPGRTYFLGFDSTYRWRYLNEQTFDGFWARLVDRAGRAKQLGGGYPFRLRTDQLSYEPGDQVRITATMIGAAAIDMEQQGIHVEIEHGDDPPVQLMLEPGRREGEFEATFPVDASGTYLIQAWIGERHADEKVRMVSQQIRVEPPSAEYEKPILDKGQLELLSSTTGGRVFNLDQIDQLPSAFRRGKVEKLLEDRSEVWNAPIFFGFIVFAITAEWLLRKRYQLV